jgi:hypothetical protein
MFVLNQAAAEKEFCVWPRAPTGKASCASLSGHLKGYALDKDTLGSLFTGRVG